MEEQGRNKTTPIEIKEEFDDDITIQLESIKEEVLDEGEKTYKISKDKPTIVENQQQDHQVNNNEPEKTAELVPSCSTNFNNPGYPGFIEAIRQAKRKKKSHDVSFEILFSYLPESVIKQHDFNLNEWWNYCLFENKDPLETDLSVVNSYLEKKFNVGASPDDLKSISSTICLIASDKIERQIYSSSFLLSEFAKYSAVNNTDGYKTPELSCQNDSKISSLDIEIKKQDESQIASVQNENVKKSKLLELIDISDDDSGTGISENNRIVPITGIIDDQQINVPTNNTKQLEMKNLSPGIPLKRIVNHVVVGNESGSSNKKNPPSPIPIRKQKQAMQPQQLTLQSANNNRSTNNVALPTYRSDQSLVSTPAVSSKLQTSLTKTSTPAAKPPTATLPVHHNTPPLINNKHEYKSATSNTAYPLTPDGIQCTIEPVQQNCTSHEQNYQLLMSEVSSDVNGEQYITYTTQQSSDTPVLQQQQISIEGQLQQGSLDQSQKVYYTNADDNNSIPEEHQTTKENTHQIESQEVLSLGENIQEPGTGIINGQQIGLINMPANNTVKNISPRSMPLEKIMKHVVVDDESGSSYKKYPTTPIPVTIRKQKEDMQQQQSTLENFDKSDLSNTSIHSENSLDEIGLTNKTESYAYLEEAIGNPQTAIVQDQVEGNSVKMFVVMRNGKQRLITFDIPNEKITVNDLLKQAGIPFNRTTTVSLVKDPICKINYIVESEAGTITDSTEASDDNDELLNDDNKLSNEKCLQDDNNDNNIHASSTVTIKEPKYIDGKLAVCNKCGLPSIDFNRCYHCKKKIQNNPKTVSHTFQLAQKKDMMVSIDKFYKSVKVNNDIKNDSTKLNLHTTLIDPNNSSSNINKRKPTIGNTNSNDIIENMTIYTAKESIEKSNCVKLSSDNQDTNANNQKNRKSNDGIDKFINNNSTQVSTTITIEKPKYIDGKLAVCDHCGFSSIDFNRCYCCKKKIQNNTKTKLDKSKLSQKTHMMLSIDEFYKNLRADYDDGDDDNGDDDNDEKNTRKSLKLQSVLKCRTVKIGSYRYTPKEHVIMNTSGLILSVPLLKNGTEIVQVHVQYQDIYKVLIHSTSSKPILFFYTNTISGSKIRQILGMNNPKRPYYDPAGEDQTHKRIILFPKLLKSNSINILKKLFSSNTFVKELDVKEANAILLKGALLKKRNNSPLNIGKTQATIGTTNNIVKNSTIHPAAPLKDDDSKDDNNTTEQKNTDEQKNSNEILPSTNVFDYIKKKVALAKSCTDN